MGLPSGKDQDGSDGLPAPADRSIGIRHPKKAAMLSALSKTGNVSASARAAGIDRSTHYEWLHSDPEYRTASEAAFEEAVDVLEAVARKRAIQGSDTLLIFLLKCLRPSVYRDRIEHQAKPQITLVEAMTRMRVDYKDNNIKEADTW